MARIVTVKEAAQLAGVSRSLVYAWCQSGALRHSRFGRAGRRGCVRIAEPELLEFLESCRNENRRPAVGGGDSGKLD